MCQARVNFSVTNHYSSTPEVSFLFLCYEKKSQKNEKKNRFLLLGSYQKETLGLLNHRRDKYIKQQNHHSIFLTTTKGRVVNGLLFGSDRFYLFFSIEFFSTEKINSIAEPYAMYKKCPYGCLILFFIVIQIPLYFNPIVQYIDRRTVHDVISISSGL